MKREIKNKLIEISGYLICMCILLGVAYFSGYLKGFTAKDFSDMYNRITYELSQSKTMQSQKSDISKTRTIGSRNSSKYGDYQAAKIPTAVIRGVNSSRTWLAIFNSNNKTVFYLYDSNNDSFDSSIKNYIINNKLSSNYTIYSYQKNYFSGMRVGDGGASKICDSLQECNKVRQKAADYSTTAEFMKYCGATMCIINPSKNEYVRIKDRKSATKVLEDLRNW